MVSPVSLKIQSKVLHFSHRPPTSWPLFTSITSSTSTVLLTHSAFPRTMTFHTLHVESEDRQTPCCLWPFQTFPTSGSLCLFFPLLKCSYPVLCMAQSFAQCKSLLIVIRGDILSHFLILLSFLSHCIYSSIVHALSSLGRMFIRAGIWCGALEHLCAMSEEEFWSDKGLLSD